jgi:L-threonylcarbamoyladenylate synthase
VTSQVLNVDVAVEALRSGGIVAYPTETLLALGVDTRLSQAVDALRALMDREAHKPLAILVADPRDVDRVVADIPPAAARLMAAFWPGPLTLVLNAAPGVPAGLTAQTGTVAVRCSSHPVARALCAGLGAPITATGCHVAGGRPARVTSEVEPSLRLRLAHVLLDGPEPTGAPATVVDARLDTPVVVREGAVPAAAIHRLLGL